MSMPGWKRAIPGWVAIGALTLTTTLWVFWGTAEMYYDEMYYEGWGSPFPEPLAYLIPGAACLLLTTVVLAWPRFGGWLIVVTGALFTAWWWGMQLRRNGFSVRAILTMFPVSGLLVLTGVLFLLEGARRAQLRASGWYPPRQWWRRHLRWLVGLSVPAATFLIATALQLPPLLARVDDGYRGAVLIEGNGVRLIWAPESPGWNWRQPAGWHPSWNRIALYGLAPIGLEGKGNGTQKDMEQTGLCRYLSEDGTRILSEPQGIWRMPTADEKNAGCTWDGQEGRAECRVKPDKETPLWAPDQPVIYYWTADEYSEQEAWYVSYNGWVKHQPKDWGNPRHGHRCVREP